MDETELRTLGVVCAWIGVVSSTLYLGWIALTLRESGDPFAAIRFIVASFILAGGVWVLGAFHGRSRGLADGS